MTIAQFQTLIAWLFVYVGTPLAWASVVLHIRTPWRETDLGRHLTYNQLTLAVIFTFAAIKHFTGYAVWPYWAEFAHLLTYGVLILGVMSWRVWLQWEYRPRTQQ